MTAMTKPKGPLGRLEWPCAICTKPVVIYTQVRWSEAPADKTPYVGTWDDHYHADCYALRLPPSEPIR